MALLGKEVGLKSGDFGGSERMARHAPRWRDNSDALKLPCARLSERVFDELLALRFPYDAMQAIGLRSGIAFPSFLPEVTNSLRGS